MLQCDWYALFLNPAKVNYLQGGGAFEPKAYFNPRYEGKDVTRYAGTHAPTTNVPVNPSPVWFAHDVLHHLSATTVGGWFDSNPNLQYLICTAVIPPETAFSLPTLWPALYNYVVKGDQLTYVPEGDVGGHYVQPYSARRWLSTNRVISPDNACLHVALLHSSYAHHVFLISRPQLLPQSTRTLDMAPVTVVPWIVHPFGSLFDRITTPSLLTTLVNYSTRVSATSVRDLYAKVASHQAEVFGHFPSSYVRTAVQYACWARIVDYHYTPSLVGYLRFNLSYVTSLPLIPLGWYWQSFWSVTFQKRHDVPYLWQVDTKPWVASASDSVLPGVARSVCPNDISVFQLPPYSSLTGQYAALSAKIAVWLLTKYIGFGLVKLIRMSAVHFPNFWRFTSYLLDINWTHTPWGIFLSMLVFWYGLRGPTIPIPRPDIRIWHLLKKALAIVYFLPYARLPYDAGLNPLYLTLLNHTILMLAFPKFHPAIFILGRYDYVTKEFHRFSLDNDTTRESYLGHFGHTYVFRVCFAINVFLILSSSLAQLFLFKRTRYAPRHDEEYHEVAPDDQDFRLDPDESPSPPPSTSPPLPEIVPLPDSPLPGFRPAAEPIPPDDPPPPRAPPDFMPPFNPADPLTRYDIPPQLYANDFTTWRAFMHRLPAPPNVLNIHLMCVWDCLSAVIGLPSSVLWANWVATLDPVEREDYATGAVPYDRHQRVFNHFGITCVIRSATVPANAVGARGQLPTIFRPDMPPLYEQAGHPGWPTMIAYLRRNPGENTYHLTLHATNDPHANLDQVPPNAAIGWPSTLVPEAEVSEVANVPNRVWGTFARRLAGTLPALYCRVPSGPRLGDYILPAVPVREEVIEYPLTADDARFACHLATDLKVFPQTMNLHEFNAIDTARSIDCMAKQLMHFVTTGGGFQYRPVRLHLFHGAYGTGKSHALSAALLRAHAVTPFTPATLAFHTWDHDLREPLRVDMLRTFPDLGLQAANFMTGSMPLAQPRVGALVLDDAGKCWNSFIPLLLAANPGITDLYVTFDAAQAQGVFPQAPSISRKDPSTAAWLSEKSDYYATQVVRTAPDVTALYGLPIAAHVPGRIVHRGQVIVVSQSPAGVPLLAVSPRFTQTQSMGGQVADTFTESQGHTIHGDVCIDLGGLTATTTDAAAWTALTRATGNIYLKMGPLMSTPARVETAWSKSQILSALLTLASVQQTPYLTADIDTDHLVRGAVLSHLSRCLSPAARERLGLPFPNPIVGVRSGMPEHIRSPWLKTQMVPDVYTARTHRAVYASERTAPSAAFSRHSATVSHPSGPVAHIVRHFTSVTNESVLHQTPTTYQLPPDPILTAQPDPVYDINEPTDDTAREISNANWTSTFQHIPDGAPDALHHTRSDKLTDELGKQKRIRVGLHTAPWSAKDERRLTSLKKGFKKFFDVKAWNDTPFNPALMEHCNAHALKSWASKRTKKTLEYSVAKQNLDAPYTFVKLFPKGQYIKKEAKWRSKAFPSQTVSDFNLGRIFRDSPYAVYLETQILKHAYPTTYLHCRASPDDVSNWYREHWRPGIMTGNDYTAWDSGVDHVFLEFDLWLMSVCHFPLEYIEQFRHERLNTFSHLGHHMPRQESGDRWTWILNTARNAALTGASLDCPARTPVCVSGDDSVTLGAWRRTTGFNPDDWLMKPKREEGHHLEFCGLIFGGADISFSSKVVHWRARFGLQQGRNDPDYWRSIRDAIRETASKLGSDSPALAAARLNLARAVIWFNLPPDLALPEYKLENSLDTQSSSSSSHLAAFSRWMLFL
jgi:hypothetical protein